MPKELKINRASKQDTTSPKNIVKGGGLGNTSSKGWVGASRSVLPINASMFIQDLAGNKTPLTSSDMKDSEMKVLRQGARNSKNRTADNGGNTSYRDLNDSDYPTSTAKDNLGNYLRSPVKRMQTTIGGATLTQNKANTRLTDRFDYNTNRKLGSISDMTAYDALRTVGGKFGSKEGDGTPVDINLGNLKRPTKYEEETNTFMKGTKKIKVKKAVNGLQDIAVPEQGSYSSVATSTASGAAAGSAILPGWGTVIGAGVGAVSGFLQKNKEDAANKAALAINRDKKLSRSFAGNEDTINQGMQRFKNGGKIRINNTVRQDTTSPQNIYKGGDNSGESGRGFSHLKQTTKKATAVLGLAKSIPTPFTQAIGWGASGISAGIGINDAIDNTRKGNYKQAALDVGGAALDLVPLNISKAGRAGKTIDLLKKGSKARNVRDATNVGVRAGQAAALANDASDVLEDNEYRKGTKMIEIEGKKTPEIHTDRNFNVKNLGTTPHSMGGDKVEAEEGDIVFPTQNSLTKFNKIATHLQEGDKAALTKEKNKLPEDKGMKNQTGNRGVSKSPYEDYNPRIKVTRPLSNAQVNTSQNANRMGVKSGLTNFFTPKPFTPNAQLADGSRVLPTAKATIPVTKAPKSTESFKDGYKLPSQNGYVAPKSVVKAPVNTQGKATKKATPISQVLNTPQVGKFTPNQSMDADLSDLKGSKTLDQVAESAKGMKTIDSSNKAISSSSKTTTSNLGNSTGQGLNNALQFVGVANNLFQGTKSEKPIQESYYNPQTLKYADRSQSLRNQANGAMNGQIANARNLSGGSVGNLRANSNASRLSNLSTQGGIDEREQARADAITNQNTEITNNAAQVNLGRKDNYQQQMMATRAAKQAYTDQAASDIGQYGMAKQEESYMRNRDRLAGEAQMAGYKSINGRYQHKSTLDGDTYFEPDADTSITRFGTSGGNRAVGRKKTLGIFKNGTKSVNTKYKMKSVV